MVFLMYLYYVFGFIVLVVVFGIVIYLIIFCSYEFFDMVVNFYDDWI